MRDLKKWNYMAEMDARIEHIDGNFSTDAAEHASFEE